MQPPIELINQSSKEPLSYPNSEFLVRLFLSTAIALLLMQITTLRAQAGTLQTFYVSRNGDNTDGSSWEHAWNELNQINWQVVQAASDASLPNGYPYPGHNPVFNGSITVVVKIDGGPKGSSMT